MCLNSIIVSHILTPTQKDCYSQILVLRSFWKHFKPKSSLDIPLKLLPSYLIHNQGELFEIRYLESYMKNTKKV